MNRRSRLTPSKVAQLAATLGERDSEIVKTVAKLRLVTTPHIQRLHFVDGTPPSNGRRTRHALRRLTDRRVLKRLERRIGGVRAGSAGHIYALDVVGQYIAALASDGRRRRPVEPGLPYVAHRLAVSELYVLLEEANRDGALELIEFNAEPDCWRTFFGPGGGRMILKPDAFVRIGSDAFEELWFVEVDRGTQSTEALQRKFRLYRQYWSSGREQVLWGNVFPRVLWLAPSSARLRQLIDLAGAQPPESWQLFTVRLFDDAVRVFASGETS
jgi:hypothetical protein